MFLYTAAPGASTVTANAASKVEGKVFTFYIPSS